MPSDSPAVRAEDPPARPPVKRRRTGVLTRREARSGYWFLLPTAVTMGLLILYPLGYGLYISVFRTNLVNQWDFVGLDNFVNALTDPTFQKSLLTTLSYTVLVVGGTLVIGVGLALLLNTRIRFRTFFRVILILPWIFPEVVVALLWRWMLNPIYGILSYFFNQVGWSDEPIQWLESPSTALPGVAMASIWKGFPLVMVLVLAALQGIPGDLYEAAALDGANRVQAFRHVTLPGIAPVLLVVLILETAWWFKHYTIVWLMTAGGPVDATNVVSISIYRTAFQSFNWGDAAARATIILIILLVVSTIYRRVIRDGR